MNLLIIHKLNSLAKKYHLKTIHHLKTLKLIPISSKIINNYDNRNQLNVDLIVLLNPTDMLKIIDEWHENVNNIPQCCFITATSVGWLAFNNKTGKMIGRDFVSLDLAIQYLFK